MRLFIQPDTASVAADGPVFICIIFELARTANTVTALGTVMGFPFCALRADSVRASKRLCRLYTTILAKLAVGADCDTVFTFAAFLAEVGAVGTVFTAVCAKVIRTVAAIIAVPAHTVGTVNANAAVGTKFIHTSRAFAAVLADAFRAVRTNDAAVFADFRTVAALTAILAEQILCAFPADIAGSTEFVTAIGTFLFAFGADIRTVFASFTAGADNAAVRAQSAGNAETVRTGAVYANSTFRAKFTVGAVQAFFPAFLADYGAVRASAAADTDHVDTVVANSAVGTEVFFACTVTADTAVRTKFIIGTFTAFFIAFGTDSLCTL